MLTKTINFNKCVPRLMKVTRYNRKKHLKFSHQLQKNCIILAKTKKCNHARWDIFLGSINPLYYFFPSQVPRGKK